MTMPTLTTLTALALGAALAVLAPVAVLGQALPIAAAAEPALCQVSATDGGLPLLLAQSGCCSSHNGVCGCSADGRTICCDATLSPTCTCTPPPTHTLTITAGPSGTPNPVVSEGTVGLTVTAVDSLSHALSYSWSSTCPGLPSNGGFNSFTSRTPTWTAPANTTGGQRPCTIQVSVSDGQGLTRSGSFSQVVNATAATPPPTGPVAVNISASQVEVRSADTFRITNATVSGYPGTYWADIQWNGTFLAFVPIAAGQETSPAFYDKTELLKGRWHFVYTIGSPPAFTDDYTLAMIPGTTNSQGGYYINGTNQYGQSVLAAYWPTDKNWTLLDPGTIIDQYYTFYTDGATILPNSCYRQISHPSGNLSACYTLTGSKTGSADAANSADVEARLAGEADRQWKATSTAADVGSPDPAVVEKYWIMRGLMPK